MLNFLLFHMFCVSDESSHSKLAFKSLSRIFSFALLLSLCAYQPVSYKIANDCQLPAAPNLGGNLGNRLTALPLFSS
jgi:hypothetical protein